MIVSTSFKNSIPVGGVVAAFLRFVPDRDSDEDSEPDVTPEEGVVKFTPLEPLRNCAVPGSSGLISYRIEPVEFGLRDSAGFGQLNGGGKVVMLPLGKWVVSVTLAGDTAPQYPDFEIEITREHTAAAPLWIMQHCPIPRVSTS